MNEYLRQRKIETIEKQIRELTYSLETYQGQAHDDPIYVKYMPMMVDATTISLVIALLFLMYQCYRSYTAQAVKAPRSNENKPEEKPFIAMTTDRPKAHMMYYASRNPFVEFHIENNKQYFTIKNPELLMNWITVSQFLDTFNDRLNITTKRLNAKVIIFKEQNKLARKSMKNSELYFDLADTYAMMKRKELDFMFHLRINILIIEEDDDTTTVLDMNKMIMHNEQTQETKLKRTSLFEIEKLPNFTNDKPKEKKYQPIVLKRKMQLKGEQYERIKLLNQIIDNKKLNEKLQRKESEEFSDDEYDEYSDEE